LPLKTEEEASANYKKPRKKEMWRTSRDKRVTKYSSEAKDDIGKEESKVLSSIGNEISQSSVQGKDS
jgi:gas vesicle protein